MTRQTKIIARKSNGRGELRNAPVNTVRPIREPNIRSDVETPAVAASMAALVLFIALFLLSKWLFDSVSDKALWGFGFGASLMWLGVFFFKMGWAEKTIYMFEKVAHVDLTGDRVIGEPMTPTLVNRYGDTASHRERDIKERWKSDFYDFVNYCYENANDTQAPTTPTLRQKFTDKQIDTYWGYMVRYGIGAWKGKSHKEGRELVVDELKAGEIVDRIIWNDPVEVSSGR